MRNVAFCRSATISAAFIVALFVSAAGLEGQDTARTKVLSQLARRNAFVRINVAHDTLTGRLHLERGGVRLGDKNLEMLPVLSIERREVQGGGFTTGAIVGGIGGLIGVVALVSHAAGGGSSSDSGDAPLMFALGGLGVACGVLVGGAIGQASRPGMIVWKMVWPFDR